MLVLVAGLSFSWEGRKVGLGHHSAAHHAQPCLARLSQPPVPPCSIQGSLSPEDTGLCSPLPHTGSATHSWTQCHSEQLAPVTPQDNLESLTFLNSTCSHPQCPCQCAVPWDLWELEAPLQEGKLSRPPQQAGPPVTIEAQAQARTSPSQPSPCSVLPRTSGACPL